MNKKNCHKFKKKKLAGDEHYRNVCQLCGYIDYGSPQVVAGSIVTYKNKFLLCKRGIHPGYGLWTLPSGFVEKNESVEMGAMREAKEEACIKIKIKNIFGVYSIKKRNIIKAFQRHFRQNLINGISDQECLIISQDLIKS